MRKVKSIGLIETLGMVGAVEAADAALKAANVALLGYEFNGSGYVVLKLTGDVAAVQAAVSAGAATAERLGNLIATDVIARPDEQLVDVFVNSADNVPQIENEKPEPTPPAVPKTSSKPPVKRPTKKSKRPLAKMTKPPVSEVKSAIDTKQKPQAPQDKPQVPQDKPQVPQDKAQIPEDKPKAPEDKPKGPEKK
jgi:ethanolamine utilization protein EutM